MTIDFSGINIDEIMDAAAQKTDSKLASKISSLTCMKDEDIKKLFPKASDAKKLIELMRIVKSAEERNIKINNIATNSEKFAGVVLTLLEKYV